jgi:hypothetical protein
MSRSRRLQRSWAETGSLNIWLLPYAEERAGRHIIMESEDTDDTVDELLKKPETEKMILTVAYLRKLKCVQDRLPTLADMEVVYPRLNEKIVFSRWLRQQAVRYIKRKQENLFIVKCPTCRQEVDRFDFPDSRRSDEIFLQYHGRCPAVSRNPIVSF